MADYRFVSEHYFETMGIELKQGRFPTARDRTLKVALISESAARKVWPGEDAIGKLIRNDPRPEWATIIGVVADMRTENLDKQPPMMVYVPYWDGAYWQGSVWGNETYVMRTGQDAAAMANSLRSAIHKLDPELPLANVLTSAHGWLAVVLTAQGKFEEAIREYRIGGSLDPLVPNVGIGLCHYLARRYDDSLRELTIERDLHPDAIALHPFLGMSGRQRANYNALWMNITWRGPAFPRL